MFYEPSRRIHEMYGAFLMISNKDVKLLQDSIYRAGWRLFYLVRGIFEIANGKFGYVTVFIY